MSEALLNPTAASFTHLGFFTHLGSFKVSGIAVLAWVFTMQHDTVQAHSPSHDKPYIVCHLIFILTPKDQQHLQVQVLQILGWLPHHVGLLGTVVGRLDA